MICNVAKQSRTFGFIYENPKSRNILTAIQISVTFPTTMTTSKSFSTPIRFPFYGMDMVTFMAHLTGIGRTNKQNPKND
jgi:hypothetical protein